MSPTRREFLRTTGAVAGGSLIAGCKKKSTEPDPPDNGGSKWDGETVDVALAKVSGYELATLKSELTQMFDMVGGLGDTIKSGDKVAIKINLTGGTWAGNKMAADYNSPPGENIWTNPVLMQAVLELLKDAGASKLYVVEGQSSEVVDNFGFGYKMPMVAVDATFIDLNNPAPYGNFTTLNIDGGGYNFPGMTVNTILAECDAYVTIPKMKCHYTAGITLSMKNNVGMVPGNVYGDGTRWGLHWPNNAAQRYERPQDAGWHLPQSICDLNAARPVDLAIIDGISSMDRGEGNWVPGVTAPHKSQALVVGKDAVKTDAIGMQVMGFDPLSPHRTGPFVVSDNFLLKAQEKGLGDPNPANITTAGVSPSDFPLKYRACEKNPEAMAKSMFDRMAPYGGHNPYV